MAGKSIGERVAHTEERIRQLEAQRRLLAQQLKAQERRERTRRLIQVGAIMTRIGVDSLEKAQAIQRQVEGRPEVREWLRKVCEGAEQPSSESLEDGE